MTPQPPVEVTVQPYYVRHRQDWAVANERQRHQQALYTVGEPALFTLMWKIEDAEAGLVGPCPICRQNPNSLQGRIQAAYKQAQTARCPACYGTTLAGGIRAQIVRPTIFTDADEDETKSPRGVIHAENLVIETTNDFRARTGDFVFRRDGSRWQLGRPSRVQVRTGYEQPTQEQTSIGYARIQASREDESSVAFEIPPTASELATTLAVSGDFPQRPRYEVINGPLIPPEEQ
jgi:hypothetical protein